MMSFEDLLIIGIVTIVLQLIWLFGFLWNMINKKRVFVSLMWPLYSLINLFLIFHNLLNKLDE